MAYLIVRFTLLPFFRFFVSEINGIENLPKSGGFILAPNHIGFIDYFFISSALVARLKKKIHFISQPEPWWIILGKKVSDSLGRIELDPEDRSRCLLEAAKVIKNGGIVCIYPEGRASKGKELNQGKTGTVRLALDINCPIVPIGLYTPIASKSLFKSIVNLLASFRKVKLNIGQPITLTENSDPDKETLDRLTRGVMEQIAILSGKHYSY